MAVWSNIAHSEISKNFGRLDAEFFRPEFISIDRSLSRIPIATLQEVARKIDVGHVGPMVQHYREDGIIMLQTQNVKEFFLNLDHAIRITPEFHSRLRKSQINKGSILIGRSGSFGSAAVYLEDSVINSADIIIVDIDDLGGVNPLFLVAFMNCRFGSTQLIRFASGGVQGHVNLAILEHFKIPLIEAELQQEIADIVSAAYEKSKSSEVSYGRATELLEHKLGLDTMRFDKSRAYLARFSSVELSETLAANRMDSQCFSPEAVFYERLLHESGRCDRLGTLVASFAKGRQQEESESGTTEYCSIKHISGREIVGASRTSAGQGAPKANLDDLLLAITGATIGKIGIVKRYEKLIFSGDMLRLRIRTDINPHYVLLVLSHHLGQVQLNRWITGSTNGHLAPRDVERILVPRLARKEEDEIAALVEESLMQRRESEKLLEQAKTRVEKLIEEAVAA